MRIFYDKDGKRISREAVREQMITAAAGAIGRADKKVKAAVLDGMSEEQYAKMSGMKYRDFERKRK